MRSSVWVEEPAVGEWELVLMDHPPVTREESVDPDLPEPAAADPRRLAFELACLGASAEQLADGVVAFDDASPAEWRAELQPRIERLSDEARDVLSEIHHHYGPEGGGATKVGDLAFCALIELRLRRERFSRTVATLSGPALATEAGGLVHNLKRALTAAEVALCQEEGLEPTLSLARELALALEVRAAYAEFRRDIEAIAAAHRPEEGDASAALDSATASIAKLIGKDTFRKLWPQDRLQLRALQARILAWRVAAVPDPGRTQGLWQDLYSCAHLLRQVNRRQELVEHDRQMLEEIEALVAVVPGIEAVRDRLAAMAARLVGLDTALDALLLGTPSAGELLAALRGLQIAGSRS